MSSVIPPYAAITCSQRSNRKKDTSLESRNLEIYHEPTTSKHREENNLGYERISEISKWVWRETKGPGNLPREAGHAAVQFSYNCKEKGQFKIRTWRKVFLLAKYPGIPGCGDSWMKIKHAETNAFHTVFIALFVINVFQRSLPNVYDTLNPAGYQI